VQPAAQSLRDHRGLEASRHAINRFLICSAGPRGLCGDPRIFDDLTKVPQVFRNPGGSPALQNVRPIHCHDPLHSVFSRLLTVAARKHFGNAINRLQSRECERAVAEAISSRLLSKRFWILNDS
jgi:hypothetical protein